MNEPSMVEAVAWDVPSYIAGITVIFKVRLYLLDGRIRAIRSVRVFDADGKPFPTVVDGKMFLSDLP